MPSLLRLRYDQERQEGAEADREAHGVRHGACLSNLRIKCRLLSTAVSPRLIIKNKQLGAGAWRRWLSPLHGLPRTRGMLRRSFRRRRSESGSHSLATRQVPVRAQARLRQAQVSLPMPNSQHLMHPLLRTSVQEPSELPWRPLR